MDYLLMLCWLFIIAIEVTFNWYVIEVKEKNINHLLAFIPRMVAGLIFLAAFSEFGYYWYWSALFLVGTHALLFAEALNISRGKFIGYLGDPDLSNPNKSVFDKFLLRLADNEIVIMLWFTFRVLLFIFAVGNMIWQGQCSWYELNHNGCL